MGIFFSLFYIVTACIAPGIVLGEYAQYHLQLGIAAIALVCSLPGAGKVGLTRMPQFYAVIAVTIIIALSMIFIGVKQNTLDALLDFIPNVIVFFFIVLNFRKKIHFQILIGALFFVAMFILYQGYAAIHANYADSPWLITMKDALGQQFYRIRGMGLLNDPNDLAQFYVCLIPCMFFFWKKESSFRNLVFVFLPVSLLVFGMYLSHSRGGMVALLAITIVAFRRKIGILPAVIGGGIVFIAISAAGFSGNRDVSAETGADRMDAWSTGIQLIKSHPIFGVGYKRFNEYFHITAHNTVVVVAAELGLVGFFFWLLLVMPTLRDVVVASSELDGKTKLEKLRDKLRPAAAKPRVFTASPQAVPSFAGPGAAMLNPSADVPMRMSVSHAGGASRSGEEADAIQVPNHLRPGSVGASEAVLPDEELRRLCSLMMVLFAGFFAAGWFLSRSYTMILYLITGLAVSVGKLAFDRGLEVPRLTFGKASKLSAITGLILLIVVYVMLRVDHMLPH